MKSKTCAPIHIDRGAGHTHSFRMLLNGYNPARYHSTSCCACTPRNHGLPKIYPYPGQRPYSIPYNGGFRQPSTFGYESFQRATPRPVPTLSPSAFHRPAALCTAANAVLLLFTVFLLFLNLSYPEVSVNLVFLCGSKHLYTDA